MTNYRHQAFTPVREHELSKLSTNIFLVANSWLDILVSKVCQVDAATAAE